MLRVSKSLSSGGLKSLNIHIRNKEKRQIAEFIGSLGSEHIRNATNYKAFLGATGVNLRVLQELEKLPRFPALVFALIDQSFATDRARSELRSGLGGFPLRLCHCNLAGPVAAQDISAQSPLESRRAVTKAGPTYPAWINHRPVEVSEDFETTVPGHPLHWKT